MYIFLVSFRGQKKLRVSFRGLIIQNFRRASPPLSYAESSPGVLRRFGLETGIHFSRFGLESGTGVYERIYRFNSK